MFSLYLNNIINIFYGNKIILDLIIPNYSFIVFHKWMIRSHHVTVVGYGVPWHNSAWVSKLRRNSTARRWTNGPAHQVQPLHRHLTSVLK